MINKLKTINGNDIKVCVIGLGYVGLPLAIAFSKKYSTIGYDKDLNRIEELRNEYDRTLEISKDNLSGLKNLKFHFDKNFVKDCNIYIITVPTPVDEFNAPDLSMIRDATKFVGDIIKKNDIIIYESTIYPGATEDFCIPIIEKTSNLKFNKEFFCGYSPERINPSDKKHTISEIIIDNLRLK